MLPPFTVVKYCHSNIWAVRITGGNIHDQAIKKSHLTEFKQCTQIATEEYVRNMEITNP